MNLPAINGGTVEEIEEAYHELLRDRPTTVQYRLFTLAPSNERRP